MRFRILCLGLMSGMLAWAIAGSAAPANGGRQLVDQKCSGCHATGPDGVSTNPDAPTFRSLYRRYPVNALRESFLKGLQVGHRNMPLFKLTPQEINAIVGYLEDLNPCAKPSSDKAAMAACFSPME